MDSDGDTDGECGTRTNRNTGTKTLRTSLVFARFRTGVPSALDEWSAEEELVDDDQFESDVEIETENRYVHDG